MNGPTEDDIYIRVGRIESEVTVGFDSISKRLDSFEKALQRQGVPWLNILSLIVTIVGAGIAALWVTISTQSVGTKAELVALIDGLARGVDRVQELNSANTSRLMDRSEFIGHSKARLDSIEQQLERRYAADLRTGDAVYMIARELEGLLSNVDQLKETDRRVWQSSQAAAAGATSDKDQLEESRFRQIESALDRLNDYHLRERKTE